MSRSKFVKTGFRELLSDARAAIVSVVVLAAIGVLWGAIKGYGASAHVAVPAVIAAAIVVAAAALVIRREWQEYGEREREVINRETIPSPDEIAEHIRSWLLELGYQIKNQPDPSAHFNILATNAEGLNANVFKVREGPYRGPYVVIATNADIKINDPFVGKALNSPLSTFRLDIALALAQLGVDFAIPAGSLQTQLFRPVLFDQSVTQLSLAREILLIHRALVVVQSLAARTILEYKRRNP